jgi:hypothetical protein
LVSLIIICRCKISVFNENVLLRLYICIIVYRQRRGSTETHNFLLSSCLALPPPPKKKLSQRYIVKKKPTVSIISAPSLSLSLGSLSVFTCGRYSLPMEADRSQRKTTFFYYIDLIVCWNGEKTVGNNLFSDLQFFLYSSLSSPEWKTKIIMYILLQLQWSLETPNCTEFWALIRKCSKF